MIETFSHDGSVEHGRTAATGHASPMYLIGPGLMIVAVTYGLARYSFGLFLPDFQRAYDLSHEALGLLASASYGGYVLAALFASWVSGLHGPRLPVVMGGLSAAFGMGIISASDSIGWLAVGVIVAGASPGFAYPPLSDAVMRMIQAKHQNRTYTIINSGTSFGVMLAGPLALCAGAEWRLAWFGFALLALVAAVWSARVMPTGAFQGGGCPVPKIRWSWLVTTRSRSLMAAALLLGISTSVYWTFAVELIVNAGSVGDQAMLFGMSVETGSRIFWVMIGLAGIMGAFTGEAVTALGLRRAMIFVQFGIAASLALLVLAPQDGAVVGTSAVLFGATFIAATALLGVWSVRVFHDRPSAGFGATFLVITVGQMISPAFAGWLVDEIGLESVFWIAAAVALVPMFLAPREHIVSMQAPATAASVSPNVIEEPRILEFPASNEAVTAREKAVEWPSAARVPQRKKKGLVG